MSETLKKPAGDTAGVANRTDKERTTILHRNTSGVNDERIHKTSTSVTERDACTRFRLPLVQCERALLGAAILHVNEALLLKKAITPDEFRYPTHREIAHAVYRLADAGLLETPVDNFIVISDALHKSGSTINHAYLVKVVGSAALPGTHFRRIGAAWREDIRRLDMARELEEQAEALRQGVSA